MFDFDEPFIYCFVYSYSNPVCDWVVVALCWISGCHSTESRQAWGLSVPSLRKINLQ